MNDQRNLGTFLGVFTPTVLTILGVIMYLRFGWLVGHLGLLQGAGRSCSSPTSSPSSPRCRSHRWPPTPGGRRRRLLHHLAQPGPRDRRRHRAAAVPVADLFGHPLRLRSRRVAAHHLARPAAAAGGAGDHRARSALLAMSGAEKALQAQVLLMVLVGISLLGAGRRRDPASDPSGAIAIRPGPRRGRFLGGFRRLLPGGDRRHGRASGCPATSAIPGRSIPRGSILAVLTGFLVYLVVPVPACLRRPAEVLARRSAGLDERSPSAEPGWCCRACGRPSSRRRLARSWRAPRTLQALARDGLAPRFSAPARRARAGCCRGCWCPSPSPLGAVVLGDLNAVAAVVSMFFLTVYGTVNLVAAFEALSGDPSWRPQLRAPLVGQPARRFRLPGGHVPYQPGGGRRGPGGRARPVVPPVAAREHGGLGRRPPRALREPDPLGPDPAQRPARQPAELAAARDRLRRRHRRGTRPGPLRRLVQPGPRRRHRLRADRGRPDDDELDLAGRRSGLEDVARRRGRIVVFPEVDIVGDWPTVSSRSPRPTAWPASPATPCCWGGPAIQNSAGRVSCGSAQPGATEQIPRHSAASSPRHSPSRRVDAQRSTSGGAACSATAISCCCWPTC